MENQGGREGLRNEFLKDTDMPAKVELMIMDDRREEMLRKAFAIV